MTLLETPSGVEEYSANHGPLSRSCRRARMGGAVYDAARRADKERAKIAAKKREKRTMGEKVSASAQ